MWESPTPNIIEPFYTYFLFQIKEVWESPTPNIIEPKNLLDETVVIRYLAA